MQRSASGPVDRDAAAGAIESKLAAAGGSGGEAVPEHLQEKFAAAGTDVSGVRVHTGSESASAAEAVSARAFAVGQDVHFGAGQYKPGTNDGDTLIAHELAHTVQQRGSSGTPQFGLEISQPHDPAEVEADQFAEAIVNGSPSASGVPTLRAGGVQRKIMRWADPDSGARCAAAIEAATHEQLDRMRQVLGDAQGSPDPLIAIEIPGYAGYVSRADVPELYAMAERRFGDTRAASRGAGPLVSARDAHLRLSQYTGPAQELSQRVMRDIAEGRVSHLDGRAEAAEGRNALREATRERLSPGGRATSEAIEPRGATLAELADRYALRALQENPALRARFNITNAVRGDAATEAAIIAIRDSEQVSLAIVEAAGRSNRVMTGASQVVRVAGPVLVGAQIAVGGYRVLTAEEGEHMWTAGEELSSFAGGTLGASAGGVVLSTLGAVAVGAGVVVSAPVAIVVSILVVGGMAMAGSWAGQSVWDRHVDHDSMHHWEIEFQRAIATFARASTGDRIAAGMGTLGLAAGGGYGGLMDRDRRRMMEEMRRPPPPPPRSSGGDSTSGGEAP
ncbi:MAG TPA: DUF4157 domain-containing protein [Kofleriaceae bacterium]|nr:DUF4157 domain-containing protein [Kofleriaceae bacterium]